jgi:hypothetical protein
VNESEDEANEAMTDASQVFLSAALRVPRDG